ncbi:MAG: hypothetical protein IE925_02300 [Rhodobacterales bacterium]|nr:hypothetical protein [Rhodobacterales bacterium]
MTNQGPNTRVVTTVVPTDKLEEYLHSQDVWQAIFPKAIFDVFEPVTPEKGVGRSSHLEGKLHASMGIFAFNLIVNSERSTDGLQFSGDGKLAKIAPVSLKGTAVDQGSETLVSIRPSLEGLPGLLQRMLAGVEQKLALSIRDGIEAYHTSTAG